MRHCKIFYLAIDVKMDSWQANTSVSWFISCGVRQVESLGFLQPGKVTSTNISVVFCERKMASYWKQGA